MVGELTPTDRVFAALIPPPVVVAALDDWTRRHHLPGRLVAPRDWHITLRFVGECDQVRYERWCAELASIETTAVAIRLAHLGAVPRPSKATVLWIGAGSIELAGLADRVESATVAIGIPEEERPYRPHLTLARLRPPVDVFDLLGTDLPPLRWTAREFHTMTRRQGHYDILDTFPIG